MPASDVPPLNPPQADAANSSVSRYWAWNSKRYTLAQNTRGIYFVPYSSTYRPTVLNFNAITGVIVESTVCPNDVLTAAIASGANPQPVWVQETLSGNRLVLNQPATALRFTAKVDAQLIVDILT